MDDNEPRQEAAEGQGAMGEAQPEAEPQAAPESSAEPDPAPAENDEETPISPDSLLLGTRVAREMFGALYTRTTTHGPAQLGDHNTMNNYFGKRPLDPIIGRLPGIEDLRAVYVATGIDDQLDDLLSKRSTVCLVGPRNSGRYSTACAALARQYGTDRVYEIALPTDVLPETLNSEPARLAGDSGFVLRLPGDGHFDAMRKLAALFRRRNSTLLLIKDEESQRWDSHGAAVLHQAPDEIEVFKSHLKSLLPGEGDAAERYLTEEVTAALKAVYGPKESVAIAQAIADERPTNAEAVCAILERSQPKRRERAVAILQPRPDGSAGRGHRASQHERAFRLSYAVFYRRPLHYVFEAADWLLREIDSAALRPDWGKMALRHPVRELLGDALAQDWKAGHEPGNAVPGASRLAWIRDPGLRGAIIDVAWHDFDGTRKSLLNWLDRLVTEGDDVMQRAAAETAGLLVHYDFTRVHEDLVDRWAGSRKASMRQAAAWTMTLSDMAGDVGPRVRAKLSEWCFRGNNYQRDTAARVYASGLEQAVLAWSMLDLARIAVDKLQRRRHAVAEAVNQLYAPARASWILTELAEWTKTPELQIHAARALLALVRRVEPNAPDGRPELLERLAGESENVEHLGRLWLVAFLDSDTAPAAADGLARWIRHADANDEFRPHIVALLDAFGTSPMARRRIDFYLKRMTWLSDGLPDWARGERRRDS